MPYAHNPFDNNFKIDPKIKLLKYPDRIQGLKERKLKPPIMVDVDIVEGFCNLDCAWCSQAVSRSLRKATYMDEETMIQLGEFCRNWEVKSWRIAGDSEPTLNKHLDTLIAVGKENGIDMGLTTNGVALDRFKNLHDLTWIGVSLDATNRDTWSALKRSPPKNYDRIINNMKRLVEKHPELDLTIKYHRWDEDENASKDEFYKNINHEVEKDSYGLNSNFKDAEGLPELSEEIGCEYKLSDAFPKNFPDYYKFNKCLATPLEGVFGADHKFHLCCDARNVFVLTDDYTRHNWQELINLWGSKKHLSMIDSIEPKKCIGCSKFVLNSVIENIVFKGEYTPNYQTSFI